MTRPWRFPIAGFALLLAVVAAVGRLQAQTAPQAVQGRALDANPESRAEAVQSIDAAVAAALIGAIAGQFGERKVEVKLDRLHTDPVSLVDLAVTGEGRLRIGDDEEWLPVSFEATYDSMAATVVQPRLIVGDEGVGEAVAVDSALGRELQARASDRLRQEFIRQSARLHLDRISQAPAGKRYARLEGIGTVDFADEGSSVALVRALYDRNRHEWLQVGYELSAGTGGVEPVDTP